MKILAHFALSALILVGIASAQKTPAVDVFGGYSYLGFDFPANPSAGTSAQRLGFNGWDASASIGLFRHLAAEADISGHSLNNCDNTTFNCTNFSYMFGPRFNIGDHSGRFTGFVHALAGRDNATLVTSNSSNPLTDTSLAAAAGAGVDYWPFPHIGIQLGPVDYFYTRHLNDFGLPSQNSFRASAGIALRFGGELPASEPKPAKEPKAESESHRSWKRPWHKTRTAPSETQPTTTASTSQPSTSRSSTGQSSTAGVQPPTPLVPSRGMPITSLGVVVAPQEFDGAKILEIAPGGVAEMASLKPGDLIKSVDGKAVRTPMELAAEISDKTGKVRIGILRGSFATETTILLGGR
jgi:hypothetical protein